MKNTNKYKKLLEEEKKKLLAEISTVAIADPTSPNGWEAMENDLEIDSADENDTADEMEELSGNEAILDKLAPQLKAVEHALEKIKKGTYGLCDVDGEEIPEDRLKANPSATTCIRHAK